MVKPCPAEFLARLREAHSGMGMIFTRGGCYELYRVMRVIWPEAEPWYDFEKCHVYVRIGAFFYDIEGRHRRVDALPMRRHWSSDRPHRWARRTDVRVIDAREA